MKLIYFLALPFAWAVAAVEDSELTGLSLSEMQTSTDDTVAKMISSSMPIPPSEPQSLTAADAEGMDIHPDSSVFANRW